MAKKLLHAAILDSSICFGYSGWCFAIVSIKSSLRRFGRDSSYDNGEVSYSSYITWQGESTAHVQNIHYLHGALHVFDKGSEIEKFTWIDTGKPLIEQTREALTQNRFPVFVAEGDSKNKKDKITHSGYLYHSYKSFS